MKIGSIKLSFPEKCNEKLQIYLKVKYFIYFCYHNFVAPCFFENTHFDCYLNKKKLYNMLKYEKNFNY